MKYILALLFCAAGVEASLVHAHGFWILPSSTVLSSPQFVTFDAAVSNDPFHFNHRPLQIDALTIHAPDGSKVNPLNVSRGELRTTFDANLEQKGTYRLVILREGLRAFWKEGDQPKRFMGDAETLFKSVPDDAKDLKISEMINRLETFVTIGSPTVLETAGKGLEMMTSIHPNDLIVNEPLTLQFLVDGKPAEGVKVEIIKGQTRYRNNRSELELESGKNGKVTITLPEAGMYWLDANFSDDKVSDTRVKKRDLAYKLTFEVLPQ